MFFGAGIRRRLRRIISMAVVAAVLCGTAGALVATVTSGLSPTRAGADQYTNNGDNARDGWYPDEPNLSPTSITSGDFGQLFSTQLTGAVYGQPLGRPAACWW